MPPGAYGSTICAMNGPAQRVMIIRYARYSQREVPELLVRRFRPRMFVPSLLKQRSIGQFGLCPRGVGMDHIFCAKELYM